MLFLFRGVELLPGQQNYKRDRARVVTLWSCSGSPGLHLCHHEHLVADLSQLLPWFWVRSRTRGPYRLCQRIGFYPENLGGWWKEASRNQRFDLPLSLRGTAGYCVQVDGRGNLAPAVQDSGSWMRLAVEMWKEVGRLETHSRGGHI
jgi:hypothetical protein